MKGVKYSTSKKQKENLDSNISKNSTPKKGVKRKRSQSSSSKKSVERKISQSSSSKKGVKRKRSQISNKIQDSQISSEIQDSVEKKTTIISSLIKKHEITPILIDLQIIHDFYIESILDYTYYIDIAYHNAIREVNEDLEFEKQETQKTQGPQKRKITNGGNCDNNYKINFESYKIFENTDKEAAQAADTEFKNSIIADNYKDFNNRSGSISLKECLTAGEEAKGKKIPMDKGERYNIIKKELLSNFNNMVIEGDNLAEMLQKGQQIAMSGRAFVDTQPNGLNSIIEKSTVYTSFIDAFDSASAKLTDIKKPNDSELKLANSGLKFLKSRYVDLDKHFEEIQIQKYVIDKKIPIFKFKFTFKDDKKSQHEIDIPTGPTGELSVPRITRTIINNELTECGGKILDMIKTEISSQSVSDDEKHKIFNTLLIYFKCAGDFLKIWFGFNYNMSNENNNQNLLATCDISLFNIAMLFNMNLKEFNTLSKSNIDQDLFKKHCWMVLGTGSASKGVDSGKKIVFANNDEFFINKSLNQLINNKLGVGNYHFEIHETDKKIKIYLLANETSILQKADDNSNSFDLLVYSFNKPDIWGYVIQESDKENLKKCKEEYSKIIKHVETFYCLSNLALTEDLVKKIINNIKAKLKYIENFQLLQRLWPERPNGDQKYKAVQKFLDSAMSYFENLSNMFDDRFDDRIPLIKEMEEFILNIDSLSKESKKSKESKESKKLALYENIKENLKKLNEFIKKTLKEKEGDNESLSDIFNIWYDNIKTLLEDGYFRNRVDGDEKTLYYKYIETQLENLKTYKKKIDEYKAKTTGGYKKKNIKNKYRSDKLTKYKKRVDEYKNKVLSKYFINKIKKHINDDNICIYKIGINKFKTIIKDIYKI